MLKIKNKKPLGNFGQILAKKFLIKKGYNIIKENYTIQRGEIDIIAKIGQEVVFIEVKTRTSYQFGNPEDAVTYHQQKAIVRTIRAFLLNRHNYHNMLPRFDIISIVINRYTKKAKIKHFKDIILPDF